MKGGGVSQISISHLAIGYVCMYVTLCGIPGVVKGVKKGKMIYDWG